MVTVMLSKKILCAALLLVFPFASFAQSTKSSNLTNTANVVSLCSLQVTQNISFGSVDALSGIDALSQGSVQVRCTYGSYAITVGRGLNDNNNNYNPRDCGRWGCTYTVQCIRAMANADKTSKIPYELYKTSEPSSIVRLLGGTSSEGAYSPDRCDSTPVRTVQFANLTFNSPEAQSITLYARATVSDKNSLKSGVYTDSFTVSVVF